MGLNTIIVILSVLVIIVVTTSYLSSNFDHSTLMRFLMASLSFALMAALYISGGLFGYIVGSIDLLAALIWTFLLLVKISQR